MKTFIIVTVLIIVSIASFDNASAKGTKAAAIKVGSGIVEALKRESSFSYSELIPSITEIHALMKDNEKLYGANLQEAAQDMTNSYVRKFLPAVDNAFENLLKEGERKGIVWSTIQFVSVETDGSENESPTYFSVVISANGVQHTIRIDNAFFVNGEFRANQHIRFV